MKFHTMVVRVTVSMQTIVAVLKVLTKRVREVLTVIAQATTMAVIIVIKVPMNNHVVAVKESAITRVIVLTNDNNDYKNIDVEENKCSDNEISHLCFKTKQKVKSDSINNKSSFSSCEYTFEDENNFSGNEISYNIPKSGSINVNNYSNIQSATNSCESNIYNDCSN